MALIQNGGLGLAPNCLVQHGVIQSAITGSCAIFVYDICLHHGHICLHIKR